MVMLRMKAGSMERCPALLREFIETFGGNRDKAAKALDIGRRYLNNMVCGHQDLSDNLAARIKELLHKARSPLPSPANHPEKSESIVRVPKASNRAIKLPKDCPPLLIKLIEKTGGKLQAARALGFKTGGWIHNRLDGITPFTDEDAATVRAYLAINAVATKPNGPEPAQFGEETGSLGVAIVLAKPTNFEALMNAATAIGGSVSFKKRVGASWIGVVKLDSGRIGAYRAIASLIATAVIAP